MNVRRSWKLATAGLGVTALVVLGAVANSVASDEPDDAPDSANSRVSDGQTSQSEIVDNGLVMSVVDPLLALVNPNEGGERVSADGAHYGYAGVTVDPEARRVDVYWVGVVEPKAKQILDDAPAGVTVRVHQDAKYTLFEMLAAVEKVTPLPAEDRSDDWMIMAAGPEPDGSGIWIEYSGTGVSAEIAEAASRVSGVDISSVEQGQEMQPAVGSLDG